MTAARRSSLVLVLGLLCLLLFGSGPACLTDDKSDKEGPRRVPDWRLFRGDAARSAEGIGRLPSLSAIWRRRMHKAERDYDGAFEPMSQDEQHSPAHARIKQAEDSLHKLNQPIIPAFSPIVVTISRGEKKTALLLYKNYWGLVARNPKSGQLAWGSPSSWSLERMLSPQANDRKSAAIKEWLSAYQSQYPQILFENSTLGTLSTDGRFVYAVEDLAVPPPGLTAQARGGAAADRMDAVWNQPPPKSRTQERADHGRKMSVEEEREDNLRYLLEIRVAPYALPKEFRKEAEREEAQRRDSHPSGRKEAHRYDSEIEDAIQHSRLQAFELKSNGKLVWELGAGEEKGPLSECYFLGPPLPLDGLLYLLVERSQQLCLATLDPARGRGVKIVSVRPLARMPRPLWQEPLRRVQGAHLAYGAGVLVCPSNAGLVVGVEALTGRVAWEYRYRQKSAAASQPPLDRGDRIVASFPERSQAWHVSAPVIADGKVILTPPDAAVIFCLNLRDGSLLWSRPKGDEDLYLGGVVRGKVVIVGKSSVRCLGLERGETLWTVETGLPSGQGIAADGMFYLPLATARATKQPEVCVLDVNKGRVAAHIATQPRTPGGNDLDVPGNLLFADGDLISLTPWEVVAYPQLKVRLGQIEARLARNPSDPIALTERAALRRNNGDLTGAIADLREALKNTRRPEARWRTRGLLFDTLTELLRRDSRAGDDILREYEELSNADPEGATDQDRRRRQKEQHRRRVEYLLTLAQLREAQGRVRDALKAYLELAALGPRDEMIPSPDDPALRVRRDVGVRGRVEELYRRATPEQRKQLDEEMRRRLKDGQGRKDVAGLRDGLALFGDETAASREARLVLAEVLMDRREFLEAEMQLQRVRRQRDDPAKAARAVEMLARLMMMHGLLPDAVHYYRILRRDFAAVKLPDGRAGADVWDALSTDKRFLPYLDESDPFTHARLRAQKEEGSFPRTDPVFQFEHVGERLPFFRQHRIGLSLAQNEFRLIDRTTGEQQWGQMLPSTSIGVLVARVDPNVAPRFRYHALGHLIVMPVERSVFGIDPVKRRVVWEKDTTNNSSRSTLLLTEKDGTTQVHHGEGWVQYLGQDLVASPSVLCLRTRVGLQALDPQTGQLLWHRTDVAGRVRIFGDDEFVLVVRENTDGEVVATRVLRLADGRAVSAPDFAALFTRRVQLFGRAILLADKDADAVTLRLHDLVTGADVWKETYRAGTIVMEGEIAHLTGAVEPDGKVHVVDLRNRKEVMTGKLLDPKDHLKDVTAISLLADDRYFYLAFRASSGKGDDDRPALPRGLSNLAPDSGLRDLPVNGYLYAFERTTGEVYWHMIVRDQRVVLDPFADLPVVLLTARRTHRFREFGGLREESSATAFSIEKRSGKMLVAEDDLKALGAFYAVRFDPRAGTIDFVSPTLKIRHRTRAAPAPPGK